MMTVDVFLQEVGVHELGVREGSKQLVVPFSLVDELMTNDGVESSEITEDESELEPLSDSMWFNTIEPGTFNTDGVTADDEGPHPSETLHSNIDVKRIVEPLVFEEGFLALLVEVLIFLLGKMIFQRS